MNKHGCINHNRLFTVNLTPPPFLWKKRTFIPLSVIVDDQKTKTWNVLRTLFVVVVVESWLFYDFHLEFLIRYCMVAVRPVNVP
ncbi:hypothetical protein JTE90_024910 [Oedothorax gibbosus]|uniref:Uncharacterized protein n=1 Tax=Oedothorax gibbosus TaxID=931172 RepID=A0AAV6U4Y5_9ARAC|nr:hypothetical protein JTE90_024910 [Oedothorax gibbosus]